MSDELQIQQSTNTTPYAVGGSLIGGGLGWAGAHYLTKPKYGSYDDIIKEAKDSTDFSSKIEKAEGEEKKFLEAAKDLAGKRSTAETEYNNAFEAWKKDHPNTTKKEDAKYGELKTAQKQAEEALEAKKKALIDAEFEKIKSKASKSSITGTFDPAELPTLINEATDKRKRDFNAKLEVYANRKQTLLDKLDQAKKDGNKELEKQVINDINAFEKQMKEELNTEISSWYKNPNAKASKRAINTAVDNATQIVATRVAEKDYSRITDTTLSRLEKQVMDKIKSNGSEAFNTLIDGQKGNIDGITKAVDHKINVNRKQKNILEGVKYDYEKMLRKAKAAGTPEDEIVKQFKILWGLISKTETVKPGVEVPKEFKDFVNGLKTEEKAAVERLLKDGEFTIENFDKALAKLDKETKALTEVRTRDLPNFKNKIKELGGDGATFVDGVLRDKKGNLIDMTTKHTFTKPTVGIPNVSASDVKKAFDNGEVTALTDEEIRKQAEQAVKESAYQTETNAVNTAKKAAEDYYNTLPEGEALTAEQQEAKFLKEKCGGAESKAKYLDGKVEETATQFKNNFKSWLERKWGFAEHTNAKIAGVAIAGAAIIGGIAAALAPKDRA